MSTELILLLMSYLDIILLLSALAAMVVIFVRSSKKKDKIIWLGRALVIPFLLIASVINMFIIFSSDITSMYDVNLVQSVADFFSLMASVSFIVLIVGQKHLARFL